MNKLLGIYIVGVPVAQPRPKGRSVRTRNGGSFVQMYEADRNHPIKVWKETLAQALTPHVPSKPYVGPLRVDASFYFPRPQYAIDQSKYPDHPYWHDKRPDVDNTLKSALDAMTTQVVRQYTYPRFFDDDGCVCGGLIFKFICARNPFYECPKTGLPLGKPGLHLRLYQLCDEDLPHAKTLFTPAQTTQGPEDRLRAAARERESSRNVQSVQHDVQNAAPSRSGSVV